MIGIRFWLTVAALFAAGTAGYAWVHNLTAKAHDAGRMEVRGQWDAEKVQAQAAAASAARMAYEETKRRIEAGEKADHEQTSRLAALQADADRARGAADGLRKRIAALSARSSNSGLPSDPAATRQREAIQVIGIALNKCAARYLDLAHASDTDRAAGLRAESAYDALKISP